MLKGVKDIVEDFDLRVESRFKNAILYDLLYSRFRTLKEASVNIGVSFNDISGLLTLRINAYVKISRYNPTLRVSVAAMKVCTYFDKDSDYLFPPSLYNLDLPQVVVREFRSQEFLSLQEATKVASYLPSPEDTAIGSEARSMLSATLESIPGKNVKEVITMRYGLDGNGEHTLDEIAKVLGCSRENVRAREIKGLRGLREPNRSRPLRVFVRGKR